MPKARSGDVNLGVPQAELDLPPGSSECWFSIDPVETGALFSPKWKCFGFQRLPGMRWVSGHEAFVAHWFNLNLACPERISLLTFCLPHVVLFFVAPQG